MEIDFRSAVEDQKIEDILVRPNHFLIFKEGSWQGPFQDEVLAPRAKELLMQISENAGIELGLTQPSVDAYLNWGAAGFFRAHAVIAPMSTWSFEITLRRLQSAKIFSLEKFGIHETLKQYLLEGVRGGANYLISGATGSGKSSFLHSLMSLLNSTTRVLILEDSPELSIPNACSSKLIGRSNRYGHRLGAEWSLSDLVFESLRMRPDRLVLGECRGKEAIAVGQALRTGHRGVMTTLHAGSCREALERFADLSQDSDHTLWDGVFHLKSDHDKKEVIEFLCPKHNKIWNFSSCEFNRV
jgi:pilus assembly protein CpaF